METVENDAPDGDPMEAAEDVYQDLDGDPADSVGNGDPEGNPVDTLDNDTPNGDHTDTPWPGYGNKAQSVGTTT